MPWDGVERRKDYGDIHITLALIEQKVDSTHKAFRCFEDEVKLLNRELRATVYGDGAQPGLANLPKQLEEHAQGDRWGFGILGTMIGFVLIIVGWTVFFK